MCLENWYITSDENPWTAPELIHKYAHGNIYGSSLHNDGNHVKTSYLVEINLNEGYVVTRSGSRYELGTPDPEYAAQYNLTKGK